MADVPKKPEPLPGDGLPGDDDLDLELEKWGDAFNALTTGASGPLGVRARSGASDDAAEQAGETGVPAPPPEVDKLFDDDGLEFGEALGDLLGAPLPLPLADAPDEVVASAPRPPGRVSVRNLPAMPILPLTGELPPAPTDDEIFGEAAQKEFGSVLAGDDFGLESPAGLEPSARSGGSAPGPVVTISNLPSPDDVSDFGGGPDGPSGADSTRIADIDAGLLARSALPAPDKPSVSQATAAVTRKAQIPGLSDITRRAPAPLRRGPAVVRRGELRPADEPAGGGDFDSPQSTRIADVHAMEQLAESAIDHPEEELRFDQPPPGAPGIGGAVGVELDDSFYDNIEIGSSAPPAPTPAPASSDASRRTTQNVVRRNTPVPGVPKLVAPEPARPQRSTRPPPPPTRPPQQAVPGGGIDSEEPESIEMIADEPDAGDEAAAAAEAVLASVLRGEHRTAPPPPGAPERAAAVAPGGDDDDGDGPTTLLTREAFPVPAAPAPAAPAPPASPARRATRPTPRPTPPPPPQPSRKTTIPPPIATEPAVPSVVVEPDLENPWFARSAAAAAPVESAAAAVPAESAAAAVPVESAAAAVPVESAAAAVPVETAAAVPVESAAAAVPVQTAAVPVESAAAAVLVESTAAVPVESAAAAPVEVTPVPPEPERLVPVAAPLAAPGLEPAQGAAPARVTPPEPVPPGLESGAVRVLDVPELGLDPARFRFPEADTPDDAGVRDGAAKRQAVLEKELALTEAPVVLARLRFEAGRAALAAGDPSAARDHFEEALTLDPGSAPAARALRRLSSQLGALRDAIRYMDVELSLLPEGEERRLLSAWRADLLIAAGEQDLARLVYGELLDRRPDDVRALLAQLELAFADDRDVELCDTLVRTAAHVTDPSLAAGLHAQRGRVLLRTGAIEDARAALTAARGAAGAGAPEARAAALTLARLELGAGRAAEAAAWSAAFVDGSADPALVAAVHRRRARALAAAGDLPGATGALETALVVAPEDPLVLESLAGVYEAAERLSDAARLLVAWSEIEPDPAQRARVLRRLAGLHARLADPAAAAAVWAQVAEADPADADAVAELEAARLAAGDVDGAAAMHGKAAEADPAAVYARVLAARIFERAGRHEEAIVELWAARALTPDSAPLAESLARLYAAGGRWAELADLLAEHADADPMLETPLAGRVRAARAADTASAAAPDDIARAAGARAAWARVLEADPESTVARLAALRLAERSGDDALLAPALADAQAAARDPALAAERALRRATLARATGTIDAAPLEQALAGDPGSARLHAELASLEAAGGRWEDLARRHTERAELLPEGTERHALRFAAAALLEERTDALAAATSLLAPIATAYPGFLGARVLLERAFRRIGDPGALAAQLARSLGLAGEDAPEGVPTPEIAPEPAALRFARLLELGELYESRVGDPARALAAFAAALALRPDDPVALSGFQRACEATGELRPLADRALAELERAEQSGDPVAKVAAYEQLARVDGELRGDHASALLAWETIAELDPTRMPALRALERHHTAAGADADLSAVLEKIEALCDAPGDVVVLAMARARLEELQGHPAEALAATRRALAAAPGTRMALFRLEAHAREHLAIPDMAALTEAIASFFTGDARAQGVYLTRAGDLFADLDRPADAVARFKSGTDIMPDHVPALRAWRRVALAAGLWPEAVEASEREAGAATVTAEKVRLYHLAATCAMDKGLETEKATENLRRVLALDPCHEDALLRLRQLYEEQGRYEDLVQLLDARVEVETDRTRQVELHLALAGLFRDFLGDRDRAKAHFRAVLQRDPVNPIAVGAVSDIAWEQGQWQEAADALIQRARLEKNPRVLKEVFYRLGLIYAERLPDPRWALKSFERVLQLDPEDDGALEHLSKLAMQTGDWRLALGATERLVALDTEPPAKIEHLHRAAHILQEGFKEPKRAEDALRRALDTDLADPRALEAIVTFYAAQQDLTSLRVQMDRVAGGMRQRLRKDPHDATAYRVISRALAARARANVPGSIEAARCAAELAHALGGAEDLERLLAAEALRQPSSARGLGSLGIDDALFHPSIPSGFRQVFRLLHDTLAKRYAPELRRWGVTKADKLPRSGHPVKDLALAVAADLGLADIDVYVSTAQPTALGVELTDPLTLIIGSHLAHAEKPPQLRFAVGRALKLAVSYMGVPARLTPEELGALVAGVIRQYDPNFAPPGISAGLVAEEQQKLGRLISKRLRDEVYPFASEVAALEFDPRALWAGVQHTGNRAGLIASSSALAALVVLLRIGGHKDIASSRGDVLIEELMRFAVSDEHAEVRRVLASDTP